MNLGVFMIDSCVSNSRSVIGMAKQSLVWPGIFIVSHSRTKDYVRLVKSTDAFKV